ncbi:MAG TPA: hypothetical protein VKS25_10505 [Solirubrobacteraceae bacterium]|nr:hypothetical protein [Solirubrobacteraceae bacterium]
MRGSTPTGATKVRVLLASSLSKRDFPNEDAARKLIYLAVTNAVRPGHGPASGPPRS